MQMEATLKYIVLPKNSFYWAVSLSHTHTNVRMSTGGDKGDYIKIHLFRGRVIAQTMM